MDRKLSIYLLITFELFSLQAEDSMIVPLEIGNTWYY